MAQKNATFSCAGGRAGPHEGHSVNEGRENPVNGSYRLAERLAVSTSDTITICSTSTSSSRLMENPNVPEALEQAREQGLDLDAEDVA